VCKDNKINDITKKELPKKHNICIDTKKKRELSISGFPIINFNLYLCTRKKALAGFAAPE